MDTVRILIADDSKTDRLILQTLLKKQGYPVYIAKDGFEAVEIFKEHRPDIVLLDAIMPGKDGFEAAQEIKVLSGDSFIPIIFLTSLSDAPSLARCLEVGGDDFLTKPYNQIILRAKIEAFSRMQDLYQTVQLQRDQIQAYTNEMVIEQKQAKAIFDNIAHRGCLDNSNIRYNLSPLSIFNGDILLAAEKPVGGIHVFLGDFTGHGLPAAVGAMPVSEIFYGMTLKGFAMEEVLKEINTRLCHILPVGAFCCAIFLDIEYSENRIRVWNGGLPDGYIFEPNEGIKVKLPSTHLPLGVLSSLQFKSEISVCSFHENDHIFLATDGVIESESEKDHSIFFGSGRLESIINEHSDSVYHSIQAELNKFSGNERQTDDVTFLEISGKNHIKKITPKEQNHGVKQSLKWDIEYCFYVESLRHFDPLPLIVQPLMEVRALRPQRSRVFTVLSELYNNALDHGVLKLDSVTKGDADGFAQFYQNKTNRLKHLDKAEIRVAVHLNSQMDKGELTIKIEDSGTGFDYKSKLKEQVVANLSGRGLPLLKALCDSIEFQGKGNQVEVKLSWIEQ